MMIWISSASTCNTIMLGSSIQRPRLVDFASLSLPVYGLGRTYFPYNQFASGNHLCKTIIGTDFWASGTRLVGSSMGNNGQEELGTVAQMHSSRDLSLQLSPRDSVPKTLSTSTSSTGWLSWDKVYKPRSLHTTLLETVYPEKRHNPIVASSCRISHLYQSHLTERCISLNKPKNMKRTPNFQAADCAPRILT